MENYEKSVMEKGAGRGVDKSQRMDKTSKHTFTIDTMSEKYDMGRLNILKQTFRGNPQEAWDYRY